MVSRSYLSYLTSFPFEIYYFASGFVTIYCIRDLANPKSFPVDTPLFATHPCFFIQRSLLSLSLSLSCTVAMNKVALLENFKMFMYIAVPVGSIYATTNTELGAWTLRKVQMCLLVFSSSQGTRTLPPPHDSFSSPLTHVTSPISAHS